VPTDCQLASPEQLREQIVTWRVGSVRTDTPEWVPLIFIDEWLQQRLKRLPKDDPIRKMLPELGIEEPGDNALLRAVQKAIRDF